MARPVKHGGNIDDGPAFAPLCARFVATGRSSLDSRLKIHNRIQQRLINEELTGLRTLSERGFVSTNRLRAVERSSAPLDGDFGALQYRSLDETG
jgi:hypothetical protein